MRLSEKQRSRLYSAIAEEVMKVRVTLKRAVSCMHTRYAGGTIPADTVDPANSFTSNGTHTRP